MLGLKTYRDLVFWQTAYETTRLVVGLVRKISYDRVAGVLINQIVRSSASVGSNIAEGYGRYKGKEYARFLQIALGSANETDYWLRLITDFYPRFKGEIDKIILKNEESIKMLTSSLNKLKNKF